MISQIHYVQYLHTVYSTYNSSYYTHCNYITGLVAAKATKIGGYSEYQFVKKPPPMLMCCVCHCVSCNPQLSVCCGYLFCKSCLIKTPVCPNNCCNEFVAVPNKQVDRTIKALEVYCTNKPNMCRWQGPLSEFDSHLVKCQFLWVKCSLGCDSMMPRQSVDIHMRDKCPFRPAVCQYCSTTGTHQYINDEHNELCLNELVPCPNNCEVKVVPRRDKEKHKDICPLKSIECEYHDIGCAELVTRKYLKQHNEEEFLSHLTLTNTDFIKLQNNIEAGIHNAERNNREKLDEIEVELDSTQRQLDGLFGIWNVRINAMAATKVSGEVAPVILKLVNISNIGCRVQQSRSAIFPPRWLTGKAYTSVPFFTHELGYKMFLKFSATNLGHYSVTLHLMMGPNDDQLSWPLRGKFEVVLLNQISDCAHRKITVVYDSNTPGCKATRMTGNSLASLRTSEGWGNMEFLTHQDLHNTSSTCQFLKNDCLFFQVCKLE